MSSGPRRSEAGTAVRAAIVGVLSGMTGCAAEQPHPAAALAEPAASVPLSAEAVRPLGVGARAPAAVLATPQGQSLDLAGAYAKRPTMLIFYRGGWCPYCTVHLAAVGQAQEEVRALGLQVIAVSPDRPEKLAESLQQQDLTYQLLSDSDMQLARSFGVAFQVDDPTVQKYRGFGIDLDAASGHGHHWLPVPSVFIIDRGGTIRFAHWNADYKVRLGADDLVAAAASVAEPRR